MEYWCWPTRKQCPAGPHHHQTPRACQLHMHNLTVTAAHSSRAHSVEVHHLPMLPFLCPCHLAMQRLPTLPGAIEGAHGRHARPATGVPRQQVRAPAPMHACMHAVDACALHRWPEKAACRTRATLCPSASWHMLNPPVQAYPVHLRCCGCMHGHGHGCRWPKTSLAALRDGLRLSREQLVALNAAAAQVNQRFFGSSAQPDGGSLPAQGKSLHPFIRTEADAAMHACSRHATSLPYIHTFACAAACGRLPVDASRVFPGR